MPSVLADWREAGRDVSASVCIYYALRLVAPGIALALTLEWVYALFWMASDAVLATALRWLWHGGAARRVAALAVNSASAFANVLLALSLWLQGAGFNVQFFFHATAETLLWGYETLAPIFYACWCYWLLLSLWPFALRRGTAPNTRRLMAFSGLGVALNAPLLSLAWHAIAFAAEQRDVLLVPKTANAPVHVEPLPSPRNLVLVVAEGMEATFGLPEVFGEDATPHLTALSKEGLRFTNLRQVSHTAWTTAAMVAAQCALPVGAAGNFNTVVGGAGIEARVPGAICLGDVLQAHGYRTVYLGGASLAFGNKGEFLAEHGFDERYGRRRLQPLVREVAQTSPLGVRDDFLFAFAFDKLSELAATPPFMRGASPSGSPAEDSLMRGASPSGSPAEDSLMRGAGPSRSPAEGSSMRGARPSRSPAEGSFALALLTLDTHGPYGFPSTSCGPNTGEGLLFAIRCADRMLAEFIGEVRRRHPDALVALLSDHLGNFNDLRRSAPPPEERRLRFTVWGEGIEPAVINRRGTHFDITPTLLDLLGFTHWTELGLGASLLHFDSPWFSHERPERLRVVHDLAAIRAHSGERIAFHAEGLTIEIDGTRILATHRGLRLREAVFAIAFDADGNAVRHRSFAGADGRALLRQVEQWADGKSLAGVSTHEGFNQRLPCGDVGGGGFFAGRIGAHDFVCGPLGSDSEALCFPLPSQQPLR